MPTDDITFTGVALSLAYSFRTRPCRRTLDIALVDGRFDLFSEVQATIKCAAKRDQEAGEPGYSKVDDGEPAEQSASALFSQRRIKSISHGFARNISEISEFGAPNQGAGSLPRKQAETPPIGGTYVARNGIEFRRH